MHLKTLTNTPPHLLSPHQLLTAPYLAQHHFLTCPLCAETFSEKSKVQKHLTSVHNVTSDGLQKLLDLVIDPNDPKAKMPPTVLPDFMHQPQSSMKVAKMVEVNLDMLDAEWTKLASEDSLDTSFQGDKDIDDQFRCQTCSKTFLNIDQLYSHQNELGHLELKQTPRGPGYLCWKKGCNQYFKTAQALQMHFREIHAKSIGLSSSDRSEYKYQCQICTLAFKSQQKLHFHAQMHIIKSSVTCNLCSKTFPSIEALRKHIEGTSHDLGESEMEQYRAEIYANALAFSTFLTDPKLRKVLQLPEGFKDKENTNSDHGLIVSENGIPDGDNSSSRDISPARTPGSMENGNDKGSSSEAMDLSNNDLNSKEQQFFEDYINSQAFAEHSYEDPNRKFKCHRCKVAFTKQQYLAAHNKTLMHKKGDKLNYPMEKFLDPNRPYKCEVCKESFTQKNILLVHYNSVSHLHKMKQHMSHPDGSSASLSPAPASTDAVQISSVDSVPASATITSASNSSEKSSAKKSREASPEDDSVRPFKCNICKVSYSQGSTLDIHIRSVAHQTRASKLHELAMAGEVDLSRPLIEEPVDKSIQAQQKLLNDFLSKQTSLSQQSLLFSGLPGLTSFPGIPGMPSMQGFPLLAGLPPLLPLSLPSHMFPLGSGLGSSSSQSSTSSSKAKFSSGSGSTASKALEKISEASSNRDLTKSSELFSSSLAGSSFTSTATTQLSGSIQMCQRCTAVFNSAESFAQHQLMCSGSSASPGPSPGNKSRFTGRVKTAVQRNLLENFGFECVMQFNEFNQRRIKKEEEACKKEEEMNEKENDTDVNDERKLDGADLKDEKIKDETEVKDEKISDKKEAVDLPEMNKSKCNHCGKQFSSVWVLKAHEEEVHKEVVPIDIVEEVGDKVKSDFEKKIPKEVPTPELPSTPLSVTPTPEEKSNVKQEMPPPPPPPPPSAQMSFDMLNMMNMIGMGMLPMPMMMSQPSMMPMMMPHPGGLDMPPSLSNMPLDPSVQRRQMEAANAANQKRARTRINDEQLKVLRGYFDINNSPSEEQIQSMSEQTGLPMKVIKHWFRNTLFKERQRNKDSPYNFNNPPSTTLDLEEYEKTGKLTVIEDSSPPLSKSPSPAVVKYERDIKKEVQEPMDEKLVNMKSATVTNLKPDPPKEPMPLLGRPQNHVPVPELPIRPKIEDKPQVMSTPHSHTAMRTPPPQNEPKPFHSAPSASQSPMITPPAASSSFMQSFASSFSGMSTPNFPPTSTTPNSSTPTYDSLNYSPPGSGSTGRRANRTRFTDYQIKCLQEYFEQNAYPKDDELEHLSKMLGLSPRVIVVWFQNARQKARKIYENQPQDNVKDASGNSPYGRTSGLNYQCKKCSNVFQRYYDLIRHQKRSNCYTDAEKQESHMLSDDSDSISNVTSLDNTAFSDSESECSNFGKKDLSSSSGDGKKFQCDKCEASFSQYEHYREHQSIHSMYMNSAFGMLQNMAANSASQQGMDMQSPIKRKYEDEEDDHDQPKDKRLRTTILPEQLDYLYQKYQIDCNPSRKQLEAISKDVGLKKRVVQVWFQNTRARERKGQYRAHQQLIHKRCPVCRALFRAKSALESHLATKHPDEMAKGEINIDAIPDAAIESPGPSPSNMLPPSPDYNKLLAPPAMQGLLPYMPQTSMGSLGFPPMADPIQMSMKQFYEDSFKKYINELSSTSHSSHKGTPHPHEYTSTPMKAETQVSPAADDDAPLDLSKPLKISTRNDEKARNGPNSRSSLSSSHSSSGDKIERQRHNSGRNSVHSILGSAVDQAYMMNRFNHDNALHHGADHDEELSMSSSPTSPAHSQTQSGPGSTAGKRYRTQMTSLQVRIMKHIFLDYKTPTMAECEMLGRVIGLQKRVVQVWFQNARAKEKKAKLNMKSYGSDMDFPKPPEECTRCNFKYSHKYTIQDHIFTKKHIDKVREFIQSQSDAEREMTSSVSSMGGVSGLLHTSQASEMDHMRKMMEEASAHNQLAQLQSMGLGPLGIPSQAMSGMGLLPPELLQSMKKDGSLSKEGGKSSGRSEGTEHLLGYDPMTYGTPLPLLQIPQQAIKDVSSKLMEPKATIGQYTQDCKSISSLKSLVSSGDYSLVREATVDVGYICKKCQMVYPAKDACVAHQRLMCFPGGKFPEGVNITLKLEQIQYECKLCSDKMSTVQEFKSHCDTEAHKTKLAVHQQQRHTSGATTPKTAHIHSPAMHRGSDQMQEA
ncbi:ZFHX4-like protein [Mya arenaria]|uniref:ZFHX4-like protein n=1 Tax=Mya arenaria TaxID=6604 RepID=A0ABY7ET62_MYAAR|nr:ZFHX4-like protein [Mya arenaria]